MKNLRPALLTATLLLAGCASSGSHPDNTTTSNWWNPVSWSWSSLAPWNWFGSSLEVSEQGVGGINSMTALQETAIEQGLGGRYTLRKGMRMESGSVVSFWQALDDNQVKMELSGDSTVSRIVVMDADVATEKGVTLGTPFSDLYSKAFNACQKGSGVDGQNIECTAPGSQHIHYIFSGDWHGPEGLMPSDDTLQNWTLSKIIWQR